MGRDTFVERYDLARAAIDLALGRGGDQAVVKSIDQEKFYGGKSVQIERNTRVKARERTDRGQGKSCRNGTFYR